MTRIDAIFLNMKYLQQMEENCELYKRIENVASKCGSSNPTEFNGRHIVTLYVYLK